MIELNRVTHKTTLTVALPRKDNSPHTNHCMKQHSNFQTFPQITGSFLNPPFNNMDHSSDLQAGQGQLLQLLSHGY